MHTRRSGTSTRAAALAALALWAVAAGARAQQAAAPAAAPPQPPVNFRSEQAEYRSQENLVIFEGQVVVTQGDDTMTADRMEATLVPAPEEQEGAGATGGEEPQSQVKRIVATGNVTVRHVDPQTKKERYAVGERGDYDADARTIVLTGNPRLWEGKSVLTGDRITFFLDTELFRVEGKVNLTVYPEETKGQGR